MITWVQNHLGWVLAAEILILLPLLVLAPLIAVVLFNANPPKYSVYYGAAIAALVVAVTIAIGSGFTLSGGFLSLAVLIGGIAIGSITLLWIIRMAMK